jgi:23S rRNA pseudouridine1911/1915/1917 synthase
MHQVRAHLAAIGSPVVGDSLYGGRTEPNFCRFFLHARSVQLLHPRSGSPLRVESPLPVELQTLLREKNLSMPTSSAPEHG